MITHVSRDTVLPHEQLRCPFGLAFGQGDLPLNPFSVRVHHAVWLSTTKRWLIVPAGKLGQCIPVFSVEEFDSICLAIGAYEYFVEIFGGKVGEHGRMRCFCGGWLAREGFGGCLCGSHGCQYKWNRC